MKKQLKTAEGIIIITILITLLVCPRLYAAEEKLPTPEEIIEKNIEAIGGIKALQKIKNKKIIWIRKVVRLNYDIKDTVYSKRPNSYYFFADSIQGISRGGTNGKMAWGENPYNGARLYEGDELSKRLFYADFDGPDGPGIRYKSMKTEGIEKINGKDCYKVVKTPEKGTVRTVFYDKNTFMIVKTGVTGKVEEYYEDYRQKNGIYFPYKKVEFSNGKKSIESKCEKIELNIEMPEGIFDIPEEIKTIINNK